MANGWCLEVHVNLQSEVNLTAQAPAFSAGIWLKFTSLAQTRSDAAIPWHCMVLSSLQWHFLCPQFWPLWPLVLLHERRRLEQGGRPGALLVEHDALGGLLRNALSRWWITWTWLAKYLHLGVQHGWEILHGNRTNPQPCVPGFRSRWNVRNVGRNRTQTGHRLQERCHQNTDVWCASEIVELAAKLPGHFRQRLRLLCVWVFLHTQFCSYRVINWSWESWNTLIGLVSIKFSTAESTLPLSFWGYSIELNALQRMSILRAAA